MPRLYYLSSNKAKLVEEQEDRGAALRGVGGSQTHAKIYFILC